MIMDELRIRDESVIKDDGVIRRIRRIRAELVIKDE